MSGLPIIGKSSLGIAIVAGKKLVPNPAIGKTALESLVKFDFYFQNNKK